MPSDRFPSVTAPPDRPRRLHPASTFRDVPLRQVVGGLAPLVILAGSLGWVATVALLTLVLGALAIVRILAWQRHTYRLTDDAIVERKGVLNRRERVVEFARIQQVEVNRTVVDRFLGTAELRIETAGDATESELVLRVVVEEEAQRLRAELRARRAGTRDGMEDAAEQGPAAEVLVEVPLHHVLIAAVTGTRLLIVPAVLIGLLGVLDDLQVLRPDPGDVESFATTVGIIGALVLVLVLAVVGIAGAAVTGVLRDGDFRLVARGGDLHVRRGLLATREAVVPRSRLQRVTVKRNWIRRTLGYGTVTLHSAGGRGQRQSAGEQRSLTIPLLPESSIDRVVRELLRRDALPSLRSHPDRARWRAMFRWSRRLVVPAAVLVWLAAALSPALAITMLAAALVASVPLGLLEHRNLGNGENDQLVAARHGALNTATVFAPRRKVQGVTVSASWFQRRRALATLDVHVAGPGGGVEVLDLDAGRARELGGILISPWVRPGATGP